MINLILDEQVVKELIAPVYEELRYDNSPELKDYKPEGCWFKLDEQAGFINCKPLNNVMWECHVYIEPEFRGKGSEQWAIQVADFMRKNLGAKKFLAITPYEAAKKYAERAGFKHVTTLTQSILKNGKLLNQYLLEMN